jgi:hypothetical protein
MIFIHYVQTNVGQLLETKTYLDGLYANISPFYLSKMKKKNQIWRESMEAWKVDTTL